MIIGERLREIREQKNLSQGDLEHKTGLLRCYISRVENGHTVPSIGTLEKWAGALEVPLYQIFYDGEKPLQLPALPKREKGALKEWGVSGKAAGVWNRFHTLLSRMDEDNRSLLLFLAQKMANTKE
jgi:transcriptional regulator with XRE-family HTH domain